MSDKTWKRFERNVSDYFNTYRNPLSSRFSRHDTESDTLHPHLYIEAKRDRKYFPRIIRDLIDDVRKCAKKEKKTPVIALKMHDKRGFFLLIHSSDLTKVAAEHLHRNLKKLYPTEDI